MGLTPLVAALGLGALMSSKKQASANGAATTPTSSPQVDAGVNTTSQANNLGRAALIMTSPQGVQGTNPTGRYKILGN